MEVEVKIKALLMDPQQNVPILVLKDINSERILPIWIGAYEANAIALEIEKILPPRPQPHDLMRNLIMLIGAQVHRIVVTESRDSSYIAVIELLDQEGSKLFLDARPSDSIALALRVDCPIFVNEELIRAYSEERGGAGDEHEDSAMSDVEDEWPDVIGEAGDLPM